MSNICYVIETRFHYDADVMNLVVFNAEGNCILRAMVGI